MINFRVQNQTQNKTSMKYLFSFIVTAFFCLSVSAADITVTFTNLRSPSGTLIIGIYDKASAFPKEGKQIKKVSIPVNKKSLTTTLTLPEGEYAFAICHDEDNNGTCNQNFLGIPQEGFAFSNNFRPKLKAPAFNDVKFKVGKEDMKLNIKLIYF